MIALVRSSQLMTCESVVFFLLPCNWRRDELEVQPEPFNFLFFSIYGEMGGGGGGGRVWEGGNEAHA